MGLHIFGGPNPTLVLATPVGNPSGELLKPLLRASDNFQCPTTQVRHEMDLGA